MQLSAQLSKNRPVFALDDRVVESGVSLPFDSIEQVAKNCLKVMHSILSNRAVQNGKVEIDLAGWSYGGVVAVEIAKQITLSDDRITVRSVAMFDSPLRSAVVQESAADHVEHSPFDDANNGGAAGNNAVTLQRAEKHFKECTALLTLYHQRPQESQPLRCSVLDVRPESTDYVFEESAVKELTSGSISKEIVPGTHWTMLYNENAASTAQVLERFWKTL